MSEMDARKDEKGRIVSEKDRKLFHQTLDLEYDIKEFREFYDSYVVTPRYESTKVKMKEILDCIKTHIELIEEMVEEEARRPLPTEEELKEAHPYWLGEKKPSLWQKIKRLLGLMERPPKHSQGVRQVSLI